MDPFLVYKMYLALKLHFTTESYDITKHRGAVRGKKETFLQRKDLTAIRKLARDYSQKQIRDFLVANFVSGDKWGGVFDTQAMDIYNEWVVQKKRIMYTFATDLDYILMEMEKRGLQSAINSSEHPLVLKLLLGKKISLESVVILDKLFNFVDNYKDDFVLKDTCLLVKKYQPFLAIDSKKLANVENELDMVRGNV